LNVLIGGKEIKLVDVDNIIANRGWFIIFGSEPIFKGRQVIHS
jgi:hypothetical protein